MLKGSPKELSDGTESIHEDAGHQRLPPLDILVDGFLVNGVSVLDGLTRGVSGLAHSAIVLSCMVNCNCQPHSITRTDRNGDRR